MVFVSVVFRADLVGDLIDCIFGVKLRSQSVLVLTPHFLVLKKVSDAGWGPFKKKLMMVVDMVMDL